MGSNHTCLGVLTTDFAVEKSKKYFLQVFLKEWRYIEKEVFICIIDDLESSSEDFDEK